MNVARALAGHNEESPSAAGRWQARKGKSVYFRAPTPGGRKGTRRIIHQRCGALDVHKRSVTACLLVWDGKELIQERKKEFGTSKKELERLASG